MMIAHPCASSCNPQNIHTWAGLMSSSEKQVKEAISKWIEVIVPYQAAPFPPIPVPLFLFDWTHGGASVCQGKETLQVILSLYISPWSGCLSISCMCLVSTAPFWEHL